jgi:hypothetical protein
MRDGLLINIVEISDLITYQKAWKRGKPDTKELRSSQKQSYTFEETFDMYGNKDLLYNNILTNFIQLSAVSDSQHQTWF